MKRVTNRRLGVEAKKREKQRKKEERIAARRERNQEKKPPVQKQVSPQALHARNIKDLAALDAKIKKAEQDAAYKLQKGEAMPPGFEDYLRRLKTQRDRTSKLLENS